LRRSGEKSGERRQEPSKEEREGEAKVATPISRIERPVTAATSRMT
jgi:hypothetical protein